MGREAGALHGRDGHRPDRQGVGSRTSADHAEKGAGQDADLGRPSAGMTQERLGQLEEEGPAAGTLQHNPEDHEPDEQGADDI